MNWPDSLVVQGQSTSAIIDGQGSAAVSYGNTAARANLYHHHWNDVGLKSTTWTVYAYDATPDYYRHIWWDGCYIYSTYLCISAAYTSQDDWQFRNCYFDMSDAASNQRVVNVALSNGGIVTDCVLDSDNASNTGDVLHFQYGDDSGIMSNNRLIKNNATGYCLQKSTGGLFHGNACFGTAQGLEAGAAGTSVDNYLNP